MKKQRIKNNQHMEKQDMKNLKAEKIITPISFHAIRIRITPSSYSMIFKEYNSPPNYTPTTKNKGI